MTTETRAIDSVKLRGNAKQSRHDGYRVVRFSDNPSVESAIGRAAIGWTAEKIELQTTDNSTNGLDSFRALRRADTGRVLSIVGKNYGITQQTEGFAHIQPLIDRGEVKIVAAGETDDGARVFLETEIVSGKTEISIGQVISTRATFVNSHTGKNATQAFYNVFNLTCFNGMCKVTKSRIFSVRHSSNAAKLVDAAMREFQVVNGQAEQSAALFNHLLTKRMTPRDNLACIREALQEGAGSDDSARVRNVDRIVELVRTAPGAMPGTAFGTLMGLTYFATHEQGRTQNARARGTMFGEGQSAKLISRSLDVVTTYAEAMPSLTEAARLAVENTATGAADFAALLNRPVSI